MNIFENTLQTLQKQGYTEQFQLLTDCIYSKGKDIRLAIIDFTIDAIHRFPGNPYYFDESILYVISSTDGTIKGILINPFDVYEAATSPELSAKFKRPKE